jgi:hypothetical protein
VFSNNYKNCPEEFVCAETTLQTKSQTDRPGRVGFLICLVLRSDDMLKLNSDIE